MLGAFGAGFSLIDLVPGAFIPRGEREGAGCCCRRDSSDRVRILIGVGRLGSYSVRVDARGLRPMSLDMCRAALEIASNSG